MSEQGPSESAMGVIDRARSHPLRRQILLALRAGPLTPGEFANEVGEDTSHVARNFRALRGARLIELVTIEPVRGAFKRRVYRLSPSFTAELCDTAALDRIADLVEAAEDPLNPGREAMGEIAAVLRASGRPVS
jgi:DNA-binding transcriptional ArsR family regulator